MGSRKVKGSISSAYWEEYKSWPSVQAFKEISIRLSLQEYVVFRDIVSRKQDVQS